MTSCFSVGYSEVDITPQNPVPLCGYGNGERRIHTEVLDPIFLSYTAFTDEAGQTAMLVSIDFCVIGRVYTGHIRDRITKATGVPGDHIMVSVSHTHSAPEPYAIKEALFDAAEKAAVAAMADRVEAELYFGTTATCGINFVRHYYKHDGSVVTDCHGDIYCKVFAGHTTEADPEMRVLHCKRKDSQDVVLVNWQVHPHMTGGYEKTFLSSDMVGVLRTSLEEKMNCHAVYCQGGAGNLNPHSRIFSEEANRKRDYRIHGELMAEAAMEALKNTVKLPKGPIRVASLEFACKTNKEELDLLDNAHKVVAYYDAGNSVPDTKIYAETLGIASLYHARSICSRVDSETAFDIELDAICIGDFGWAFAPFEMFDATAKYIRENSPFPYTFVSGYTNGYHSYFPTLECWHYGAYEADTTLASPGAAENVADCLLEMLKSLHEFKEDDV